MNDENNKLKNSKKTQERKRTACKINKQKLA